MKIFSSLSLFFFAVISMPASALPLPTPEQQLQSRAQWFSPRLSDGYDYSGIVALSNCSGSLVKFETSEPGDKAMILTNGHCIGDFPEPGRGVVGVSSRRTFSLLGADANEIGTLRADLLMYATMTRTDMAIYRLTSTYAQIKTKYGIDALVLKSEVAEIGTPIQVLSGYWRRGYSCEVEKIVYQLKEDDWTSEQSIRYSRPGCQVIGGTSGSPVLNADRAVVGVNNTGNEDGRRCEMNNPCEIDKEGKVEYKEGYSYGQQINWIYSCINERREVDVMKEDCLLPH